MRVLLTGGAGHIAKATIERLVKNGWDVRVIDRAPDVVIEGAEYAQCDILNYDDLLARTRGCDAVIHLAAIRGPSLAPAHEVFQINAGGTFNVFEAAAAVGIRRVVQASSINALGCTYSTIDMKLRYFPIDEAHPTYTTDPYSFSKQVVEDTGAYYWRREGISSVAFRFPGVYSRDYMQSEPYWKRREISRALLDELVGLPESTLAGRMAEVRKRALEYRTQRPLEFEANQGQPPHFGFTDDPFFWTYALDRFNFWAWLDERDAAQALEKALTANYEGAHPLYVNDCVNWLDYDSRTILGLFYPDVTQINGAFTGSSSLVGNEQARQLIGFEPEHSVKGSAQTGKLGGDHHEDR